MGTLALDIETASPFREPSRGENDTDCFEWLSVAAAYTEDGAEAPETTVLFRRGGWEQRYTADLLDRLVAWCGDRDVERTLTYNGAWFDLKHMANWADELAASGVRPGAYADLQSVLPRHVDLARAASDRHEDDLREGQPVLPDWRAYELEGIDNERVWYDDYDFDPGYRSGLGIDDGFVKGEHVGRVLGERYVDGVTAGLEGTRTHRELERLLYDYSVSDVADLFALYAALGGAQLDECHRYPLAEIDR
jgi:hypothetical protein